MSAARGTGAVTTAGDRPISEAAAAERSPEVAGSDAVAFTDPGLVANLLASAATRLLPAVFLDGVFLDGAFSGVFWGPVVGVLLDVTISPPS